MKVVNIVDESWVMDTEGLIFDACERNDLDLIDKLLEEYENSYHTNTDERGRNWKLYINDGVK